MAVLAVDGALEMTGVCVVSDGRVTELSVIRTTKRIKTPTESLRHRQIFEEFTALLIKHRPEAVVIENQHVNRRNPKTSMTLARARGVFQIACALQGVPLYTLQPSEIKKGVNRKGNADKVLVQEAVLELYGNQPIVQEKLGTIILTGMRKTDDMADALAMAHTFITQPQLALPA